MDRQNITLSLPKDLLKKAKHLAVERGTSLSGLLSRYLEEVVRREEAHQRAARRLKRRMRDGFDLGTHGQSFWKREDLHER